MAVLTQVITAAIAPLVGFAVFRKRAGAFMRFFNHAQPGTHHHPV
jgi:hypothetical protein